MAFRRFRKREDQPTQGGTPSEAPPGATSREDDEKLAARLEDLTTALGGAPAQDARIAAVERLTEMRAEGKVSEENYVRERRRLLGER